jgi:hypothetical protein
MTSLMSLNRALESLDESYSMKSLDGIGDIGREPKALFDTIDSTQSGRS